MHCVENNVLFLDELLAVSVNANDNAIQSADSLQFLNVILFISLIEKAKHSLSLIV